jgi:hypothetical protein
MPRAVEGKTATSWPKMSNCPQHAGTTELNEGIPGIHSKTRCLPPFHHDHLNFVVRIARAAPLLALFLDCFWWIF